MHKHVPSIFLVAGLAGGLAFALVPRSASSSSEASAPAAAEPAMHAAAPPLEPVDETQALPPGHPAIGTGSATPAADAPAFPLAWTTPATFHEAPNTSTMRLATYRVPRAPGDTEDTDLSVVQAGGSTDANIERWLGQFDDAGKETRTVRTIAGMKVTIVEVRGTFQGGGMTMGAGAATSHPRWALLAAIVEAPGLPYFFKMVGPEKSVAAARAPFDALLTSIKPAAAAPNGTHAPREGL